MSPARAIRTAAALALSGAVVTAPAEGATRPAPLVVRASSSSSVDIVFGRTVTLSPWSTVAKGGRQYAGFFLQPLDRPVFSGLGAVFVDAFDATGYAPFAPMIGGFPAQLPLPLVVSQPGNPGPNIVDFEFRMPAGRYRLHVLADAPAEIRIPVRGFSIAPLRAGRRSVVSFATQQAFPAPVGAPGGGVMTATVTVPRGPAVAMSAVQMIGHGTVVAEANPMIACLAPPDRATCAVLSNTEYADVYRQGQYVSHGGPFIQKLDEIVRYYAPGQLPPGPATAQFYAASSHPVDRVVGAALTLALPDARP